MTDPIDSVKRESIESDAVRKLTQAAIRYGAQVAIGRILRNLDFDAASQGSFEERDAINRTVHASNDAMGACLRLIAQAGAEIESSTASPSRTPEDQGDPAWRENVLRFALHEVNNLLTCPAAEYVPQIPEAWAIIEKALHRAAPAAGMSVPPPTTSGSPS